MELPIESVEDIGCLVRFTRKAQQLRQDDLGAMAGCSHKFIVDVEKGKETIQAGRLLELLAELGIYVSMNVPPDIEAILKEELLSHSSKIPDGQRSKWLGGFAS